MIGSAVPRVGVAGRLPVGHRIVTAGAGGTPSEFTDLFASASDPIASPWVNASSSGFFPVKTAGGIACGTTASDTGYPDCYAYYPSITGDYEIEAGIYRDGSINAGLNHEVELHLTMQESGGLTYSCEWLVDVTGSWQFMRWEGPNDGSTFFFALSGTGGADGNFSVGAPSNGDRMRWRKVGSTARAFYKVGAGAWLERAIIDLPTLRVDGITPWGNGNAGIAFFYRAGANPLHFGFTDVIVRQL